MFGGWSGTSVFGDTWEWNGNAWRLAASSGPAPRCAHSMVYDSLRNVVVLFGGHTNEDSGGTMYGDTWEWDGVAWSLRSQNGPSLRSTSAMVYDSSRHMSILFGGTNGVVFFGDTWEWDGTSWTQRSVAGPSARSCHAMAYDTKRGVAVLFGGSSGDYLNDTWEWDGDVWLHTATGGPVIRCRCAMVYDESNQFAIMFGGVQVPPLPDLNDLWTWNGRTWESHGAGGPLPRGRFGMSYDLIRNESIVFSGILNLADTWSLRWKEPVIGDVSHDCQVNVRDLLSVISAWGPCGDPCPPHCSEDIFPQPSGDCVVDINDLLMVIVDWS